MLGCAVALLFVASSAGPLPPPPPLLEPTEDAVEAPEPAPPPPPLEEEPAEPRAAAVHPALLSAVLVQLAVSVCAGGAMALPGHFLNAFTFGLWGCVLYPTLCSYGIVWIGDAISDARSPVGPAWVSSVATGGMLTGLYFGAVLAFVAGSVTGAPLEGPVAQVAIPLVFLSLLVAAPIATGIAATAAYHAYSVPKEEGDTGGGLPGIFEPARPAPDRPFGGVLF